MVTLQTTKEYIVKNKLFTTAIRGNYTYLAESLLQWRGDSGEYIDATNDNEWSISYSCINGNTHLVSILLNWKGPNSKIVNPDTHKVVLDACRNGHTDIVKMLLEWYNTHNGSLNIYLYINCVQTASINNNIDVLNVLYNYNMSIYQYITAEIIDEIVTLRYLQSPIIKKLQYLLVSKIYLYTELTRLSICKILDQEKLHCNIIGDADIQKNSIVLINRDRYRLNSPSLQRDNDILNVQRLLLTKNSGGRIPEELFYEIIKYL